MEFFGARELEELKAEVEFERELRRKAESFSRVLARELSEERREREETEKVCQELLETLVNQREEIEDMIVEVKEERRMMRVAEVMREERVRMKLSEAKIAMEEKLREIEEAKELRDQIDVSIEFMGLAGAFDFGVDNSDPSPSSSYSYHRGKRSLGKEMNKIIYS